MDISKKITNILKNPLKGLEISNFIPRVSKKKGKPPGTLMYIGEKQKEKPRIEIIDYTKDNITETEVETPEETFKYKNKKTVTWINVTGIHEVDIIRKIGEHYGLHPLVMEDIVNTNQRPKVEDHEDYLYIVTKLAEYNEEKHQVSICQLSIILGKNYVITFQQNLSDIFEQIKKRLQKINGKLRKLKSDYLAYSLLDISVDSYFEILEKIGDIIENLEDTILTNPNQEILNTIQKTKRDLLFLKKSIWPQRELINSMLRGDLDLIKKETEIYLRDIYDHTIQVIETTESLRDTISGMQDVYLSSLSNKMNEVMKVLTIIATIFIPLTFIAGIYGMNFKYMPELTYKFAYFIVWGIMILIGTIMILYFRKKKWL